MTGAEPDALAIYAATTAQVLWDMGTLGTMASTIEQTLRANPGVTGFRGLLGVAYCEVGRIRGGRRHPAPRGRDRLQRAPAEPALADHHLALRVAVHRARGADRSPKALRASSSPWRGRANSSVVSINGLVTESLAGLAVVAGDLETAERDVAEALEQASRVGARVSATRTRLTRARLLAARGDATSHRSRARRGARRGDSRSRARDGAPSSDAPTQLAVSLAAGTTSST